MLKILPALRTIRLLLLIVSVNGFLGFSLKAESREPNGGLEKNITISFSKISLKSALDQIANKASVVIIYSNSKELTNAVVSINAKNKALKDVLNELLAPFPLSYRVIDNKIVISHDELKIKSPPTENKRLLVVPVKGKVTDEKGVALPGATIRIKGEKGQIATNKNGEFNFDNMAVSSILQVSFIGYQTKEITIGNALDYLTIVLEVNRSKLDEVQVIAYGETSQRLNTGDVTTVNAKDISQQPVDNPLLALEGRVPGLNITQDNGIPGGGISVSIRGQNSITGGNDPLYVVDGVPYTSQLLPGDGYILGTSSNSSTGFGAQNGNPFSYINPADIESISVLKDAGATAIYGSRGANGVILITTKKGKAGKTKVDLNVQSGYGEVTRTANLLNTQQYLQVRNEALRNDGITPSLANGDYDLLQWDTTRYTNWQKVLIGNTAHYTDAQGAVSGGNEDTQFLIGAGYKRQTTVFPGDFDDRQASMHFSINNTSSNKKFTITLTGTYMVNNNLLPASDLTDYAYNLAPDAPPLYNLNGTLNWAPSSSGTSSFQNPLAGDLNTYQEKTNNLVVNSVLSYQLLPGLTIRSSFGYTNLQQNQQTLYPLNANAPENRSISESSALNLNNNINSWIIEPQLNYIKPIGNGKLDVLLGSTFEQNNSEGQDIGSYGYSSDQELGNLAAASGIYINNFIGSVYKYNALFGRLNYNWNDEYLIDLTARRDGSSRFGTANEFHDFGAAGIGWIFTKESIFQNSIPFLSFGKLRASYGTTGNDQIGDYKYLSLYNPTRAGVPYQGITGLAPSGLSNPNLQWELTRKLELALETGFFKDRILLSASYSRDRSSNELLGYNLPLITGFGSITSNFPATVQNISWEFNLNTTNVKSDDFSWTSNINLTLPQNKLIAFPDLATSSYANQLMIGQPISIQKAFQFEGVDPATGQYMFTSASDKFNPSYATDRRVLINLLPKFYGGFQNSFSYKSFRLDFLFQFVKQTGLNDLFVEGIPGTSNSNQFVYVLNRWQKAGDIKPIQAYSSDYGNATQYYDAASSTAAYSDASYIRLKNLSFSWQVKDNWTKAMHLQNLRLFIQGQNLITITHYKGVDPETPGSLSLPPLRILTTGIQVGL